MPQTPFSFEANQGQTDAHVRFLSRGDGYTLFLTPAEAVLSLTAAGLEPGEREARRATLGLKLVGANPNPTVEGLDPLPGRSHYFTGSDPKRWTTGVPHYARVRYRDVYPGIDLVYHGRQGRLEYDLVVAPGADPSRIRVAFAGADTMRLSEHGHLVLTPGAAEIQQRTPDVFQEVDGTRRVVPANYVVMGPREVTVQVGEYDRGQPLVIDPVLTYSTYLGGAADDAPACCGPGGLALDGTGAVYLAGGTSSVDFPTEGAVQPARAGRTDAFVVKLSPTGALVFATYLGGSGDDSGKVAVDASGNVYVAGITDSADFPVVAAFQPEHRDSPDHPDDAFLAKLDSSGTSLVYSTYLGGSSDDYVTGLVVDGSGSAYLAGSTFSNDFPTANAFQAVRAGCPAGTVICATGFVTKLDPSGASLAYSTYLGGSRADWIFGLALDPSGHAYVTGRSWSSDFPTVNSLRQDPVSVFLSSGSGVFVSKLRPDGGGLVYSTWAGLGTGNAIAVDTAGAAYVTGITYSADFPLARPVRPVASNASAGDAFALKLDPAASTFVYSTYLGGSGTDSGSAIAVDGTGHAYVGGATEATDFPLVDSLKPNLGGFRDGFITKLSADGTVLTYSTYLGGTDYDYVSSLALDGSGGAHVAGGTWSPDFPTTHDALQPQWAGKLDLFLTRLEDSSPDPPPPPRPGPGRTEQDSPHVIFIGNWYTVEGGLFSGGSTAASHTPGDRFIFTFRGTGVRWIGHRSEGEGIAEVYVDGVLRATLDTYNSSEVVQTEVYAIDGLPPGDHTLVVKATGRSSPDATGSWINVDAFDVTGAPPSACDFPPVPGLIQAEDFDRGGESVAYHDQVAGNAGGLYRPDEDVDIISPYAGGYVVNNLETGEWLQYTVCVSEAGTYRLETLASSEFEGSRWRVEIDGVDVTGPVTVPNTGSWRTFQWVGAGGVSLAAGPYPLRIHAEQEYFNLDALRIVSQ